VRNQQRGLELFFRFNHFQASLRDEVVPNLDEMQLGKLSGLELGPNRIFVEEEYSLDEKEDAKYLAYCRKKGLELHPHERPTDAEMDEAMIDIGDNYQDEEEKKS